MFVRRPSNNFVEARYADLTLAPISLHEALTARRTLKEQGRREINTRAIVRTALEQRKLIADAVAKTNAARRGKKLAKPTSDDREMGTLRGIDSSKAVPFVEDE